MIAMLASPLIKILGVGLAAALIFGVGYYKGTTECEEERDAALMDQALDAAANMRAANENLARVERERDQAQQHHEVRVKTVVKIKEKYVQAPTTQCDVSPELERAIDATSGVFNSTSQDRVSSTAQDPGATAELPAAPLSDATILSALSTCYTEYDKLHTVYYQPLADAVRTSYEIAKDGAE